MTHKNTETYPAEEIAEAREYLRKNGITPSECATTGRIKA